MLISNKSVRSAGFSLIEMMIGITILAILIAVAAPSLRNWMLNMQIQAAAGAVHSALQKTRSEAVTRNKTVEFVLLADATTWQIIVPGTATIIEQSTNNPELRSVQRLVLPNGATRVAFNNTGGIMLASPTDGTVPITSLQFSSLDLPADKTRFLNVNIDFSGRVRTCDPNAVAPSIRAC